MVLQHVAGAGEPSSPARQTVQHTPATHDGHATADLGGGSWLGRRPRRRDITVRAENNKIPGMRLKKIGCPPFN